jgi:saccharopine dehydrogenase-like NADP-dependent oxidoreductase
MKNILILGAGLVAQPIIRHLLDSNYLVTVASNTPLRAIAMVDGHPNGEVIDWSIDDKETLSTLIGEHDLTVSLLPYIFHVDVAKLCVEHKKHMVTTSYVKPEMQDLHEPAIKAGVLLLNEIGLDPGIDHMSAMRIIDNVHRKGGQIVDFYSICGALPSPESAVNPFKYKFSWSPRGVLMAGNNDARYLKNGEIVEIPTERLFRDIFDVDFPGVGILDVYPNRNSTDYIDIYGIPEAKTVYRGTFRFKGWCESLDVMKRLKLISSQEFETIGLTNLDFLKQVNDIQEDGDIRSIISDKLDVPTSANALDALEWLGWFSPEPINRERTSTFDISADLMLGKMSIEENDRDMVALQHSFLASYPDGTSEVILSRMLDYGTPATDTAIARTVALPAAIAVDMILKGEISISGVYRPVVPEIYNPVLENLELLGIKMDETFGLSSEYMIK